MQISYISQNQNVTYATHSQQKRGATCHTGSESCLFEDCGSLIAILPRLENLLKDRRNNPIEGSCPSSFLSEDISCTGHISRRRKGVEVALASVVASEKEFIGEVADL